MLSRRAGGLPWPILGSFGALLGSRARDSVLHMSENEGGTAFDTERWDRHAESSRQAISQIEWLVGRWIGHGEHDGAPRVCEVETRLLFDGSFMESRERIYTAAGILEHEDLTVYGASPEDGPDDLWAHVYMAGGVALRYRVQVFNDSVLCEPEGLGSRLSIQRDGDGYKVRIFYPDDHGSWVEDAVVEYEPHG
jgi:hypothetical protein